MIHTLSIVWNSDKGIEIGPITIIFYSLMFVIAFGLGWYITKAIFDKENEPIEKLDSLFIYMVLSILIGARLGDALFYSWDYYQDHLLEIILPVKFEPSLHFTGFAGLASHGAAIGVIVAMFIYKTKVSTRSWLWILDRVVIAVASGAVFVRIGNFFNSEIYGHTTSEKLFCAVKFVREDEFWKGKNILQITGKSTENEAFKAIGNDPQFASILEQIPYRHPSQLYESFFYIFVFAILFYAYWKTNARLKPGLLFGMFLVLLFTVRFFVEFVKESQGGFEDSFTSIANLSTGQWLSIPFIIIGLYFIFRKSAQKLNTEH